MAFANRSFVRALVVSLAVSSAAFAQGTEVAFGGLKHDASLPVEIASDRLEIDQADGTAVFSGNVIVGQGVMRMTAAKVDVFYADTPQGSTGKISKLIGSGGVTIVNGAEAAEADDATYTIADGVVEMIGNAILTQGKNALSADRMFINLNSGTATMQGRVRSILQTGDSE